MTPALPIRPAIPCPDCGSPMPLQAKPASWAGASPFVYRCRAPSCGGLLSAHPNGDPAGVAAPKDVRQARRHCHAVFDPLWLRAPELYTIHEIGPVARARALAIIRRTGRRRAYEYMAAHLGLAEPDAHIGAITDIAVLRRFYAAARRLTPGRVRDWAKARQAERERVAA